jgi:lipoyl(octanoyl) transferase
MSNTLLSVNVKHLGRMDYAPVFEAMKQFTQERDASTQDELWLLEHSPVYTQGQAGKAWHILGPTPYPVVQSDRGGQVTFHGPGQIMAYTLINLTRRGFGVRCLVSILERSALALLTHHGVQGELIPNAPGVYVKGKKIASVGLRIKQGNSYHGLCFNVDNDLTPFKSINPCGFENLEMTNLSLLCPTLDKEKLPDQLAAYIIEQLATMTRNEDTHA